MFFGFTCPCSSSNNYYRFYVNSEYENNSMCLNWKVIFLLLIILHKTTILTLYSDHCQWRILDLTLRRRGLYHRGEGGNKKIIESVDGWRISHFKECTSDSVTNYNYVGDTEESVSIKNTNAKKCTLSEIFLSEI